jgi:alanine racemase
VVKADAYGHGAVPVALALQAAGADGFSVATFDEALELRAAGVILPILVLYPVPPEVVAAAARERIALALGPGLATTRILAAAARAARAGAPALEVHLEIETGLGRGGVLPADVPDVIEVLRLAEGATLAGLWTHLAAADDRSNALAQDARFSAVTARLAGDLALGLGPDGIRRHLAGSGGVLGADVLRWDTVRTGLATYGLVPDGLVPAEATHDAASRLRPVMSLHARPVRVLELPEGHGVSYGPTYVTSHPTRIATLPLGYADGWRRVLTDGAEALVRGVRVPIVGRVAMDAIMADVTGIPGPPVTEDDEFVLLGSQGDERITAHELAAACGTISYEIVTGMSRRLARVYDAAGSAIGARTLTGGRPEWPASSFGTATSATSRSTPS